MAAKRKLKRKYYFVDERALERAQKALGVKTEAEAIRLSVERVVEMEEFWEFIKTSRRSLKPGSVADIGFFNSARKPSRKKQVIARSTPANSSTER